MNNNKSSSSNSFHSKNRETTTIQNHKPTLYFEFFKNLGDNSNIIKLITRLSQNNSDTIDKKERGGGECDCP